MRELFPGMYVVNTMKLVLHDNITICLNEIVEPDIERAIQEGYIP